jgi:hypothetical protein
MAGLLVTKWANMSRTGFRNHIKREKFLRRGKVIAG